MKTEPKKLDKVINCFILGLTWVSLLTILLIIFMLAINFWYSTSRYATNISVVKILPIIANLSVTVMIGFHLAVKRHLL